MESNQRGFEGLNVLKTIKGEIELWKHAFTFRFWKLFFGETWIMEYKCITCEINLINENNLVAHLNDGEFHTITTDDW